MRLVPSRRSVISFASRNTRRCWETAWTADRETAGKLPSGQRPGGEPFQQLSPSRVGERVDDVCVSHFFRKLLLTGEPVKV